MSLPCWIEADQVAQFVDDVCTRDAEARSKAADVFAAYRDWALDNGIKQTMSQKGLRDRLMRRADYVEDDTIAIRQGPTRSHVQALPSALVVSWEAKATCLRMTPIWPSTHEH